MNISLWIAISATGRNAIKTRLQWDEEVQGEYSGNITDTEYKIFRRMQNLAVREALFKTPTIASKVWHLFELDFNASAKAQAAIDFITANRAGNFIVAGAWHWDGRQVGTQWELVDGEPTGDTTGSPTYPINATQLLKFMPDIITRDINGDIVSTDPATVLTDVHLIQGQAPRRFA